MKKILLVIHTPPPYGGGEIQAQYLKEYFSGKEKYFVFDYSRKGHSRMRWASRFNFRAILAGIWWEIKLIYYFILLRPQKVYFTLPKSFLAFMRNGMAISIAKFLKIKVLGELPGTSFKFLEKGRGIRYRIGLSFLRKIDEIRFLSHRISGFHSGLKLQRHVIIENGILPVAGNYIDKEVFNNPILNLLYVGSIERSKGIFNSLLALKHCIEAGHNLHFNIIGYWSNPREEKDALRFIQENRLGNAITFHGILTGSSKWEAVTKCAVLIHPTYWDGVPLTILEALAVGMPVISTNIGGIPDTIKDEINGIILKENNPKLLGDAIIYFSNNRNVLSIISENNKELFKRRFDLPLFLKNMENWFNE